MSAPLSIAAGAPLCSVVVATYARPDAAARLLGDLARQSLGTDRFEVIVVDDGSPEPVAARLDALGVPFALRVVAQANAGPAAARHRAIELARAPLVVVVDDDMRVEPTFLAAHLAAHPAGSRRAVLGRLMSPHGERLRLFERYQLAQMERIAEDARAGRAPLRGSHVYTGNVSFRRADYFAVGGFDLAFRLSEDAELGMRLERSGVTIARSDDAVAIHASDHASLTKWLARSQAYGAADARIAEKHGGDRDADPWRFLFLVNPLSRPLLLLAVLLPAAALLGARLVMWVALVVAGIGLERGALAGTTLAYGVAYFSGVRRYAGSRRAAWSGLRRQLNARAMHELGPMARIAKCAADVCADHDALRRADAKYGTIARRGSLLVDAVARIGFQMMIAYRVMRLCHGLRLTPLAMIASRLIRHLYGADIHWRAVLAPGVIVVHGAGLVVAPEARVGAGCVLFQHVTLGTSIHPETRDVGAPALEPDVHVGPGAALLGPITIGLGTKIAANATLMRSVPAGSLVESPAAVVRTRSRATPSGERGLRGAAS